MRPFLSTAAAAAVLIAASPALATDGYYAHGYGAQAKGLGGASIAYPRDTLALATNPAAAGSLGDRWDVGVDLFSSTRRAAYRGTAFDTAFDGDGKKVAIIPELGWVRPLNDKLSVGIVAYGNGGMITNYEVNPFARFGATGEAGVELQQLFVSPTVSYEIQDGQTLGLALNLGGQSFKAQGLGPFAGFSQTPAAFTDRGVDYAVGYGVRLGYLGQVHERLSVGAFWQSTTRFNEFDKYRGLFAKGGDFDAPETYGLGLAFAATPKLDLVADWRRIEFSEVPSVGAPLAGVFLGQQFGADNGPGFGWRDADVIKVGANYRLNDAWQLRAGYDHSENPVPADQTLLNIVAPGVVTDQYTVGATWTRPSGLELSAYALYAPENTVRGSGSIPLAFGGGEADISLGESVIGFSIGRKR